MGITFGILSFVGKVPGSIEVLKMIAKNSSRICREHLGDRLHMNTNRRTCWMTMLGSQSKSPQVQ